MTFSINCKL